MELCDHFDEADDVAVEFRQILGGNPVFLMHATTDSLHGVLAQIVGTNTKARDVAD